MNVAIVDVKIETYIYHTTPFPNRLACMISGYHKSKGDSVVLSEKPISGYLNYIVADDPYRELYVPPELLSQPNTYTVGRSFDNPYYNEEWELYPPDLSIYLHFYENWLAKYPKYNPTRLTSYTLTPYKVQRGDTFYSPMSDCLILDRASIPVLEAIVEEPSTNLIFAEPPMIDSLEMFDALLTTIQKRHFRAGDMKMEIEWGDFAKENEAALQEIWNKYRLGRMYVIRLRVDVSKYDSPADIREVYEFVGRWREVCGKRIGVYPVNYDAEYRLWTEFKRWTNGRAGFNKNSLVDYIMYDGTRDLEDLAAFLKNPYEYKKKKRMGSNKLWRVIELFESADEETILTLTTSFEKNGY